jgi:ketosteroid isomerase-like protein
MNEQDNTTLIQNMYAAFGRGDIRTILDHLTPDVEWTLEGPAVIPFAGKRVGPNQVLQFFEALATTQEDPKLTIDQYIAQGDFLVTVGRYSAVVKATGKRIDSAVAHVFTFRNGKVSRFLDFGNTAQLADAYVSASAASR